MKINNLQIQLQSEKQERKIDVLERKFESKLDELTKKVDKPWQVVCTEIQTLKESIGQLKTNQDQLSAQQKEIQKVQEQLIARQDQIFLKQDQIQSTLSEDFKQTSLVSPNSSIVSWPPMPHTTQNVASVSTMHAQKAFAHPFLIESRQSSQPMATSSDVQSYLSDADLESLLSLDWDVPEQSQLRENKYQEAQFHPAAVPSDTNTVPCSSGTATTGQCLADPAVVIYNNSRLCNTKEVGKLAIALARDAYFGDELLSQSTLHGKGNSRALDSSKLSSLLSLIHANPAFSKMSKEEFSQIVKPKIMSSLQHHCKYLRGLKKK